MIGNEYGDYGEEGDEEELPNNVLRGSTTYAKPMPVLTKARQMQIDEEERLIEEERAERQREKEEWLE